ncbi:FAD-dependent oxidoreductase, partial [Gordonia otitidis]
MSRRRHAGLGGGGNHPPRHDAVVVGAGHNGLIAAAYLARAGRSVLVVERDEV